MSKREQLWDDEAFKRWVRDGAAAKGMTLEAVLREAGLSRFYLRGSGKSRMTNHVIAIAAVLNDQKGMLRLVSRKRVNNDQG